jgi:hypothetical protein
MDDAKGFKFRHKRRLKEINFMTPESISKEAMEKARELWQTVFDAYRKAPLGTTIDEVGTPLLAIEFNNYQQRIEKRM